VSLADRWERTLSQLREQGRFRELRPPSGIDFASNDYLGYAGSRATPLPPTTLSTSGAASRLLRGHHPIWDEVETVLARWHGAEAALVFTSGYAANEGLLSTVIGPRDWVASDRLNHACIGDGLRLAGVKPFKFRHNDLGHLEEGLRTATANRHTDQELFIVTESLFSMDADSPYLPAMTALALRYGAHLIVDCAHSTGCYESLPTAVGGSLLATVHTGGKALGVPGAYVVGSQILKEMLVNRCRHFIFTTALPPAVGEWWLAMLKRVPGDTAGRELLHANARYFRERLDGFGIAAGGESYIVPIILGDDTVATDAAKRLQSQGFDVRAVRPPTVPEGTARLRISIHADHTREQLDSLALALREVLR
jgi:8-amino-7-oxononanoate synthase